jgi:hypothetical protein
MDIDRAMLHALLTAIEWALVQLLLGHLVVRRVVQRQIAGAVHRDAIFRIGKVFGREPEIHRVVREVAEQAHREERGFERLVRDEPMPMDEWRKRFAE